MFNFGRKNKEEQTQEQTTNELYSVIQNDRPADELVWKCEKEDFNDNTQLIVMESEEALFVKDGVVVETFSGGKFTLSTANYPFINGLRKIATGGQSPFSCKIYFIDKTHKLEILWGTDSPIQMRDAQFQFAVGVRSRGSYSIQIKDAKKFFVKLVGNTTSFTKDDVKQYFKTVFQTKIKVALATVMKNCKYTVLDMNTELETIGKMVEEQLAEVLDEYGIRLVNFYISDISIPEDDPNYQKINEAYANAHAGKIELEVQGDYWNKLTAKELAKDVANNPSAGGTAAMGAGIGMGVASAGIFNNLTNQLFTPLKEEQNNMQNVSTQPQMQRTSRFAPKKQEEANVAEKKVKCPNCGQEVAEGSKFCNNCGTKLEEEYICKNCGKKLDAGSKFCSNCGTRRD